MKAKYTKEVYTNEKCLQIKRELIESVGGSYFPQKEYITKEQTWYINSKGYVHFIKGSKNILLTNDCILKEV